MASISNNDLISEDNKVYLGGYLVCLLVNIRSHSTASAAVYAEGLREQLKGAATQAFDADDQRSQIEALERADRILSRILDLMDSMLPTKYEQFLFPIYEKRDVLFSEKDQKLIELLELFCNLDAVAQSPELHREIAFAWSMGKLWLHDVRNILRQIGGSLFSLRNRIIKQDKDQSIDIDVETRNQIYRQIANLPFSVRDFAQRISGLQLAIFSAYADTPFHAKAAGLIREKVQKAISSSPESELAVHGEQIMLGLWELIPLGSELSGEAFWNPFEFDRKVNVDKDLLLQMFHNVEAHFSSQTGEPHVTPWLDLLKLVAPDELGEHILLNDEFVVQLKHRIEAI